MSEPSDRAGELLLAIEGSCDVASVALVARQETLSRSFLRPARRHAERIVPEIERLFLRADRSLSSLRAVVAGSGPGSFTGVRIAWSAARGIARGCGIPLYSASSLLAAAASPEAPLEALEEAKRAMGEDASEEAVEEGVFSAPASAPRYALFDARAGRVYGACYEIGTEAREIRAPHGGTILDIVNSRPPRGTVFLGSGAAAHARILERAGYLALPPPFGLPLAETLCLHMGREPDAGGGPAYIRAWRPG